MVVVSPLSLPLPSGEGAGNVKKGASCKLGASSVVGTKSVRSLVLLRKSEEEGHAGVVTVTRKADPARLFVGGDVKEEYLADSVVVSPEDASIAVPAVETMFDGRDACILAHGQSEAGKTHALHSNNGVVRQVCTEVLKHKRHRGQCCVTVAFFEILPDRVVDLLADREGTVTLEVDQETGNLDFEGLAEVLVEEDADWEGAAERGKRAATRASPSLLSPSGTPYTGEGGDRSGSHTVFRVGVTQYLGPRKLKTRLDVVDVFSGDDSVRNMIGMLASTAGWDLPVCLPFRQSLLTRMLTGYFKDKEDHAVTLLSVVSDTRPRLVDAAVTLSTAAKGFELRQAEPEIGCGNYITLAGDGAERDRRYRVAQGRMDAMQGVIFRLEDELRRKANVARSAKHTRVLIAQELEDSQQRADVLAVELKQREARAKECEEEATELRHRLLKADVLNAETRAAADEASRNLSDFKRRLQEVVGMSQGVPAASLLSSLRALCERGVVVVPPQAAGNTAADSSSSSSPPPPPPPKSSSPRAPRKHHPTPRPSKVRSVTGGGGGGGGGSSAKTKSDHHRPSTARSTTSSHKFLRSATLPASKMVLGPRVLKPAAAAH